MSPGSKAVLFALAVAVARETASAPTLVHAGLECIAPGRFAVVLSGIDPSAEIQTAKVYFRSQLYPDFYWVAMTYEEGRFVAILPQATPETPRVIYYLEAIDQAFEVSNRYAPEHLILALREPEAWLDRVQAAGSVFLGDYAAEALGDYCSGTNHVLPTGGASRAWSGLSVSSFQTAISVQNVSRAGLRRIGPSAVRIAEAEGLQAHASAVSLRIAALQADAAP